MVVTLSTNAHLEFDFGQPAGRKVVGRNLVQGLRHGDAVAQLGGAAVRRLQAQRAQPVDEAVAQGVRTGGGGGVHGGCARAALVFRSFVSCAVEVEAIDGRAGGHGTRTRSDCFDCVTHDGMVGKTSTRTHTRTRTRTHQRDARRDERDWRKMQLNCR